MKFLTFDTSLDRTYITLCENDKSLVSKEINSTEEKYHSVYLIPALVEILKEHNLKMQDIEAIGTNIGPGSFTGIRVCTTIARVMAQQLDIKLVGVSSLQILSKINKTNKDSAIITDARKNKAYFASYDAEGIEIIPPKLIDLNDIKDYFNNSIFVISDASMHNYLKQFDINSTNYECSDYPLGEFLAYFVYKNIIDNKGDFHWAKLKPLYIQPPSISIPKVK